MSNKWQIFLFDTAVNLITIIDYKESTNRFFVRTTSDKTAVEAAFGKVSYVEAVVDGEVAFTTAGMKEADFAEKAAQLTVVNRIRLG